MASSGPEALCSAVRQIGAKTKTYGVGRIRVIYTPTRWTAVAEVGAADSTGPDAAAFGQGNSLADALIALARDMGASI